MDRLSHPQDKRSSKNVMNRSKIDTLCQQQKHVACGVSSSKPIASTVSALSRDQQTSRYGSQFTASMTNIKNAIGQNLRMCGLKCTAHPFYMVFLKTTFCLS